MKGQELKSWVEEMSALLSPTHLVWLKGGEEERERLLQELVASGVAKPLNEALRRDCYLFRSDPRDVARVEERTFICSPREEDAGPTNNWREPKEMRRHLQGLFRGAMRGRTLYVVPFAMGPLSSPFSLIGVELTDSLYVALHLTVMTEVGEGPLQAALEEEFIPCLHSVGYPLEEGERGPLWPCQPERLVVAHFTEEKEIWSFGSGYGGNALLGKKSLALRIASCMAREGGWLAEHMLIIGITSPEGVKRYFLGAFPSSCGKTNLALLTSDLPGWKVETVGDDIAWIRPGEDGRLYALNPESGFFGVAPGLSKRSSPKAMEMISSDTLFTNVALTGEGDLYWEGMEGSPTPPVTSWLGTPWVEGERAAHPNARFTVSLKRCPSLDPSWSAGAAVPISAILFGGRRESTIPLVMEARGWEEGVLYGASLSSETTAAAQGESGRLRHDPFAMLPFCGYHMGDYFSHWLSFEALPKLPSLFLVNWFRKDSKGETLWPGFSANTRVLKWIFERTEGLHEGREVPPGRLPTREELDLEGIALREGALEALLTLDREEWAREVEGLRAYFRIFGDRFPKELERILMGWRGD